jgi:hypothetical protein
MAKDNSKNLNMIPYMHPECKVGFVGYNEHFDAYFCSHCDKWLTKICGESPPECRCNCEQRSLKPSETSL